MVRFTTTIQRFGEMGEKTGWTYVMIPPALAEELMPDNKKSFRVKGRMDNHPIRQVAVMPWGDGSFLLAVNAGMRKATGKGQGAEILVELEADTSPILPPDELMECLAEEPDATAYWESLSGAHRNYFIKHIETAKTVETRARRVASCLQALQQRMDFGQMLRSERDARRALGR